MSNPATKLSAAVGEDARNTAAYILAEYIGREPNSRYTTVDDIQYLTGFERNQVIRFFDELERTGEGVRVVGRGGAKTRFVTLATADNESDATKLKLFGQARARQILGLTYDVAGYIRLAGKR